MITIDIHRFRIGIFNLSCSKNKPKNIKQNIFKSKKSKLFSLFFIFLLINGLSISCNSSKITQKNHNKIQHICNGNISKNGTYSMISWNKGNSNFSTKRDDILITINRYHPDIFAIHEANYSTKNDGQILGYNIEHNTLVSN